MFNEDVSVRADLEHTQRMTSQKKFHTAEDWHATVFFTFSQLLQLLPYGHTTKKKQNEKILSIAKLHSKCREASTVNEILFFKAITWKTVKDDEYIQEH